MDGGFWQINIGHVLVGVCTLAGMIGSAALFVWKMGRMHGENIGEIKQLSQSVKDQTDAYRRHEEELKKLSELAARTTALLEANDRRLEKIEDELEEHRRSGVDLTAERGKRRNT